jgi:SAM-dependent methyltransferase
MKPIDIIKRLLRPNGKTDFLYKLPYNANILDVGCGNNSPYRTKEVLPSASYTGIDIGDYNQTKPILADNYIVTQPESFTQEILSLSDRFDAVISSHNLEHCDDRGGTLAAMLKALRQNGKIYLSFPCEESISFPSRRGTLNYYDDPTHKGTPPNFIDVLKIINDNGCKVIYKKKNYRPFLLRLIGAVCEPYSRAANRVYFSTWSHWGFESIIWAVKL